MLYGEVHEVIKLQIQWCVMISKIVFSMWAKLSMMRNVNIFGSLLAVAWHRKVSVVDYQIETGHSKVDLSQVLRRKLPAYNTTWFLASLMNNKYVFNSKCLKILARRKPEQVNEEDKMDFNEFLAEVGVTQNGIIL